MSSRTSTSGPCSWARAISDRSLLAVEGLAVAYGAGLALRNVALEVPVGGSVAVLGANGAGKTTLLRAITGLLGLHGGRVTAGRVTFDGDRVVGDGRRHRPGALVSRGVGHVMEGRRLFPALSVEENLRAGGFTLRRRGAVQSAVGRVLEQFPMLRARLDEPAGHLSGGQQRLVAIARALVPGPRLLLVDEPSLGLSPVTTAETAEVLRSVHAAGTALLLVEQQASLALALTEHAYVLDRGAVVRDGPSASLRDDPAVAAAYFGAS